MSCSGVLIPFVCPGLGGSDLGEKDDSDIKMPKFSSSEGPLRDRVRDAGQPYSSATDHERVDIMPPSES